MNRAGADGADPGGAGAEGNGPAADGDGDDGGNTGAGPGVYGAMRTSTAATHPPPGDHRPPRAAERPAGIVIDLHRPWRGDHPPAVDGFSAFYREAWPGVARALAVALGDRDLAVEAADEAMARAYARWRQVSSYDNPGAWVYRVGLNWARSYRRRLARRPRPDAQPDVHLPPVGDPAVRQALLSLPVPQRSVVVCRLLLDWSIEDTALALGVRPGTVQSRLHRALRSLEDALHHLR